MIREAKEIPLGEIYDHVTPAELERFETAEFIREDEIEEELDRLAALRKPRGRPRKMALVGDLPLAGNHEERMPIRPGDASGKRPRGRPRKYPAPSFNGPQPLTQDSATEDGTSTRQPSNTTSEAQPKRGRPRMFSMVAAARLSLSPSCDEEISREVTPLPSSSHHLDVNQRSARRRRLALSDGPSGRDLSPELEPISQTNTPAPIKHGIIRIPAQPRVVVPAEPNHNHGAAQKSHGSALDSTVAAAPSDSDHDERVALIRQFQPAGTLQRSDSVSSSESLMSGPTITVEAYKPQETLPEPEFSSFKLTTIEKALDPKVPPSLPASSTTTSSARSKASPRPLSLTSHYPMRTRRPKAQVSTEKTSEESQETDKSSARKSHQINSPSRKRKRSPATGVADGIVPTSSTNAAAEDEESERSSVTRTLLDFFRRQPSTTPSTVSRVTDNATNQQQSTVHGHPTSPKIIANRQTINTDSQPPRTSQGSRPVSSQRVPTTATSEYRPSQSQNIPSDTTSVWNRKHNPAEPRYPYKPSQLQSISSGFSPTTVRTHPPAPTQHDNANESDDEHSSASSILPYQTIAVEPNSQPATTSITPAQPNVAATALVQSNATKTLPRQPPQNTSPVIHMTSSPVHGSPELTPHRRFPLNATQMSSPKPTARRDPANMRYRSA